MNKPALTFAFQFVSDGTSNSVSISLATGPVVYYLPQGTASPALNEAFSASASGVENVNCDGNLNVTGASITLGILKVDLSGAQNAGQTYTVSGTLLF